jgi:hypothetical protein
MIYTPLGTNVSQSQLSKRGYQRSKLALIKNGKRIADFHNIASSLQNRESIEGLEHSGGP